MNDTKIPWADSTINFISGCYHNCPYCYAKRIAERFATRTEELKYAIERAQAEGNSIIVALDKPVCIEKNGKMVKQPYPYGFIPTFHRYKLNDVMRWKKPRNIFVGSMSDCFGAWVPEDWLMDIFDACEEAPQHNYLFLTKNPRRYLEMGTNGTLPVADNMWYGTTVNRRDDPYFFDTVRHTFLSIEPMFEDFDNINGRIPEWIIVGAETGNRKDKIIPKKSWLLQLVDQCREHHIPLFMKESLKGIWKGELIQEYPEGLRHER